MKLSIFKSACSAIAVLAVFDSTFVEAMRPDPNRNPNRSPSSPITSQIRENYADFCRALIANSSNTGFPELSLIS